MLNVHHLCAVAALLSSFFHHKTSPTIYSSAAASTHYFTTHSGHRLSSTTSVLFGAQHSILLLSIYAARQRLLSLLLPSFAFFTIAASATQHLLWKTPKPSYLIDEITAKPSFQSEQTILIQLSYCSTNSRHHILIIHCPPFCVHPFP